MKKIRVAVLYGGRSGEHEISLLSAANVIQQLDPTRFEVVPIGISKQGGWFLGTDALMQELATTSVLHLLQDAERLLFNPELIGKSMQQIKPSSLERMFDVIFPVVHGSFCEDGTLQGLLELADIPYVGCGVLSSSINMDKDVSKRLIREAGIATVPFVAVKRGEWDLNAARICQKVATELQFPVFVKPANTGSSVGVEKVKQLDDLMAAINQAFQYDTKVVIEQGIDVIELEVAVLESLHYGADPMVSVVGEVKPSHEFYSYAAKYLDENGAELIIPASIPQEWQGAVQKTAMDIFHLLECEGMARVDLFMERGTRQIYFNEVNTLPGFTQVSMYPKLMQHSGMSYPGLLTHLVMLAIARYERRTKLQRSYAN